VITRPYSRNAGKKLKASVKKSMPHFAMLPVKNVIEWRIGWSSACQYYNKLRNKKMLECTQYTKCEIFIYTLLAIVGVYVVVGVM
jgi:hypothetical protein